MSYPSNDELEAMICYHSQMVMLLAEVKEARFKKQKEKEKHYSLPSTAKRTAKSGKITQLMCNCGFVVKYRKPLSSIEDFKCPREEK